MAQHPEQVYGEAFISFCLHWIEPAARWQQHESLRQEWASMSPTQQQEVVAQIEQLQHALEARASHARTIGDIQHQLAELPPGSNDDKLSLLDDLDDEVTRSAEQCERLLAMLEVLKGDCAHLSKLDRPLRLFVESVEGWRRAAAVLLQKSQDDFKKPRAELHELKRNTPGRKVEDRTFDRHESLASEARKQASRLPKITNPRTPHLFQHIWDHRFTGCRWELKTLKANSGGMNEGIDLMYGVNEHGTIVTRAVQKKLAPSMPPVDPTCWCGDLELGTSAPILKEYATQVVAAEANGARFVLNPLRDPQNWGNGDWRLYLEYAPHGDLESVVDRHVNADTQVPEAFLWLLFQSLIETALIMKKGVLSGPAPSDWREIVHRDWKVENVVLGLPESTHFPQYPRPRVADFGVAIFTDENDPINPGYWVGEGTDGYLPPEQSNFLDPQTDKPVDDWKLLSPCNVWGIGIVMYALMTQRVLDKDTQPEYAILDNDDDALQDLNRMEDMFDGELDIQNLDPQLREPQANANNPDNTLVDEEIFGYKLEGHLTGDYDPNLCATVQQCLSFHPDERPSVENLKLWIDGVFHGNPLLRMLDAGASSPLALPLVYKPEKDQYKIGMAWNAPAAGLESDSSDFEEDEQDGDEVMGGENDDLDAEF